MNDLGKIESISEIHDFQIGNRAPLNGSDGSRMGFTSMLGALIGYSKYDGYEVKTENHRFLILIDNEQNCCESWGYLSSDDNLSDYIGKTLLDVILTDTALNQKAVDKSDYYGDDEGGIQFVDFKCSGGSVLQLAVYNAHNGYYGHPIFVIKDEEILLSETL